MNRQQIMLVALTVIGIAVALDQAYRRFFETPYQRVERQIETLEDQLRRDKLAVRQGRARFGQVESLAQRSLPSDPRLAISEYRNWLLRTLQACDMKEASVDATEPTPFQNLLHRIDFSLRTRGTLTQTTQFLHRFYATDYLHKIRSLTLTPTSDGTLDISLSIETLSLRNAASKDQLAERSLKTDSAPLETFDGIAQRNLFRAGEPLVGRVRVSAITRNAQDQRQVWLGFPDNQPTRFAHEGDKLTIEGSHLQIVRIAADRVEIDLDGARHEVRIGQTLR